MAQNADVALRQDRYTRADFTALRAKLNHVPLSTISNLYYTEDALMELGCLSLASLEQRLSTLAELLTRRLETRNPALSSLLTEARRRNSWSKTAVDYLVQAADADVTCAYEQDSVGLWFKPRVAAALKSEQISTLAELKKYIERLGSGWYRPVPRMGAKKALAIQNWFSSQPTLGALAIPADEPAKDLVVVESFESLAPLERIQGVTYELAGHTGRNRNASFCLISARNDLEALQAYLYKFRGQPKTLRAYRKELERFLLWCVLDKKIPMSSVLTEECEAYKDFLGNVSERWIGRWAPRQSSRWRPFSGQLSPASQKYAIQVVRAFFEWLVKVRYLGGNPWVTVADPAVAQKETSLEIQKALPGELWALLSAENGLLNSACNQAEYLNGERIGGKDARVVHAQYRLARAAIFLMGFTGLRREEVCGAIRSNLRPVPGKPLWELRVLGKRKKWRTVFMPLQVVEAIRAHWADRGHDFEAASSSLALVSPVVLSNVAAVQQKHWDHTAEGSRLTGAGFTPDALYQVVKRTLRAMALNKGLRLSAEQIAALMEAAPHAFRHTFGTQAAAQNMPIDVLQKLMGHSSIQTTSIYVQAERQRSIEEASKFFGKMGYPD